MGCGCGKKRKEEVAKQAAKRAEEMERQEAVKLVPLGLKDTVRLPARVANTMEGKPLIIKEKGDDRVYRGGAVVAGRDGLVPLKIREQLVAQYPSLFREKVAAGEGEEKANGSPVPA